MFNRTKLLNIGGSVLPRTWQYSSTDDITTNGYFPKESRIQSGDKLTHVIYDKDNASYNMTTYYVDADDDGILSVSEIPGGGSANLKELEVDSHIYEQIIIPAPGWDGYNKVTVHKVTSAIDSNITAGNIRKDVSILGVTGTVESTIAPVGVYMVVNGVAMKQDGNLVGRFDGITEIATNAMYNAFYPLSDVFNTPVVFPDLVQIGDNGMYCAFNRCYNITSVNFPSLTAIASNNAMWQTFQQCYNITSANFDRLVNVSGANALYYCFQYCNNMTTISFPNLTSANGNYAFSYTFSRTNLSEASFPKLISVGRNSFTGAFQYCNNLTKLDFSNVTTVNIDSFRGILGGINAPVEVDFSSLPYISSVNCFYQSFYNSGTTSANFAGLKNVSATSGMYGAFYMCRNLTSFNMDSLESISGGDPSGGTGAFYQTFGYCNSLTKASFPKLKDVNSMGSCFYDCNNLTNVYMPNLYNVGYNAMRYCFSGCSNLTNVTFDSLYNVYNNGFEGCFNGCTNLTELRFPALGVATQSSFNYMLNGCSNVTVHFPAAMQSTMSSWTTVTSGFKGTNTTILWDL